MNLVARNELADAIGGARTLVELAPKLRPEAVDDALRKLKTDALHVASLAKEIREDFYAFLRLPDDLQTDAALTDGLVHLGFIAARLEKLAESIEKYAPMVAGRLSAEIAELAQLADDFRDLEETFALTLSAAFGEEIKKAREEALRS